jgi:hypothetical protein
MLNDGRKAIFDPSATATDLKVLADKSKILNRLTDDLSKHVDQIESVINALNLGLSGWVWVEESSDDTGTWTHYIRLWYEKNEGRWGLSIDEFDEYAQEPDEYRNRKSWVFKDAPRALRLKAVEKIPALIKVLCKEAEEMTAKTAATVTRAQEIASCLSKPTPAGSDK